MTQDPGALPDLGTRYRLEGELGRGGFGAVYRAVDLQSGQSVALKLSLQALDPDQQARLLREVRLVRDLRHPGLVPLLDLVRDPEGRPALVYQLVEGEDLARSLARESPSISQALDWLEQVGQALDALHRAGLVHRDLKPGNLMREETGRIRLLDYGLLRPDHPGETLTATGMLVGTPEYLAPECLESGTRVDFRADLYALGCLAHHFLVGQPPYLGNLAEVLQGHTRGKPPPLPVELAREYPGLEGVFASFLARRQEERPGSGKDLVGRLRSALEVRKAGGGREAPETLVVRARPACLASPPLPQSAGGGPGPRRILGVLAGVLLVGVASLCFHLGGKQAPPEQDPTGALVGEADEELGRLLEEAREELERAGDVWIDGEGRPLAEDSDPAGSRVRSILGSDITLRPFQRKALPALSQALISLSRQSSSRRPSERLLGSLRDLDRSFELRSLPPPFLPFREAIPSLELESALYPFSLRRCLEVPQDLLLPLARTSGACRGLIEALNQAAGELTRLQALAADGEGGLISGALGSLTTRGGLLTLARRVARVESGRRKLEEHFAPLARALRQALRRLPLAISEHPEEEELLCFHVRGLLSKSRFVVYLLDLPVDPDLLLGFEVHGPAQAAVLAELLYLLERLYGDWNYPTLTWREASNRWLDVAFQEGGTGVFPRLRRVTAGTRILERMLEDQGGAAALAFLEQHRDPLLVEFAPAVENLFSELARSLEAGSLSPFSIAERKRLLELLTDSLERLCRGEIPASHAPARLAEEIRQELRELETLEPEGWSRLEQVLAELETRTE